MQNLLNASALWWSLLIPLVILLYFLKLKREEYVFPSTLLWQRVMDDMRVNSPFQKLKNNLLLFLQILLLIFAILGLSRPFLKAKTEQGRHIVLLIDVSASMQANDEGKSRLALAKEKAQEAINDLSSRDKMMIITFANKAQIEQPFTRFQSRLTEVVNNIKARDGRTQIKEALTIAKAMLQKTSFPSIYVLTDGAIPNVQAMFDKKGKKQKMVPKFVIVGKHRDNVGILAFDVRLNTAKQNYQGFLQIQNFGTEPVEGFLELFINGTSLEEDIRLVELGPGDVAGILFPNIPLSGILKAKLTIEHGKDYLHTDNEAWFVLPTKRKTKLCLVTTGNFFLKKALLPHDPNLTIVDMAEYQKRASEFKSFDAIVFDSAAPTEKLPPGGYILFNCLPITLRTTKDYENVTQNVDIVDQDDLHPIMRFVNIRKIHLSKILKIEWPEDAIPLLETQSQTAISLLRRKNNYFIIVGFDIFQSDWPLRFSFPIFIANTIRFLKNIHNKQNISIGSVMSIKMPDGVKNITIKTPTGKKYKWQTQEADVLFPDTEKRGIYQVKMGNLAVHNVAANLFSDRESQIAPVTEIKSNKKNIASRNLQPMNQEIWQYLVLIAFFVLLIEWYVYNRRSLFFWKDKKTLDSKEPESKFKKKINELGRLLLATKHGPKK